VFAGRKAQVVADSAMPRPPDQRHGPQGAAGLRKSWSCFEVRLDLNTGLQVSRMFTMQKRHPAAATSHQCAITERMIREHCDERDLASAGLNHR
jgi:hypothetical protein